MQQVTPWNSDQCLRAINDASWVRLVVSINDDSLALVIQDDGEDHFLPSAGYVTLTEKSIRQTVDAMYDYLDRSAHFISKKLLGSHLCAALIDLGKDAETVKKMAHYIGLQGSTLWVEWAD